jgi:transcriptional regulator with XRE-family HTH domain
MDDSPADASPIRTPEDLGKAVRRYRKSRKLTQEAAAALSNVSVPFLSNFENGKPTAQIGKILQTLKALGMDVFVVPRGRVASRAEPGR